jgi:Domain of unknown function (DUF1835)
MNPRLDTNVIFARSLTPIPARRQRGKGADSMPATLHITNGESVQLGETGLSGEVLTWQDMLHEGPVLSGLTLEEMRTIRARFLAGISGRPEHEIRDRFEKRDRTLTRFGDFEEVVLWFEHDLYDQLQLIQILDWFSRQDRGRTTLSLIATDRYLGLLRPDELLALSSSPRSVSLAQLVLGRRAWLAFAAEDPSSIVELLQGDTSALPYLRGALQRHLEQFPSTRNGLSRTERQILQITGAGPSSVGAAFCADRDLEERIFMGDLVFQTYVRGLANARVPLLKIAPDEKRFWDAQVVITSEGSAVLRGEADHVRVNGIDRWLGGVHLERDRVWRWDDERRKLTLPAPSALG